MRFEIDQMDNLPPMVSGESRTYVARDFDESDSVRSDYLVSSVIVNREGGHDRISIYSRGAGVGWIKVRSADAPSIIRRLFQKEDQSGYVDKHPRDFIHLAEPKHGHAWLVRTTDEVWRQMPDTDAAVALHLRIYSGG